MERRGREECDEEERERGVLWRGEGGRSVMERRGRECLLLEWSGEDTECDDTHPE